MTISSSQTESLPLLLTIQVELLACGQVKTPLLAGRQSGPLGTCSGEVVFVSWGREAPRGLVKRPLIREDLNVIQSTSPRRLMPHLLHQMVQNLTNLGGHSIQMITRINQATTIHQSATNTESNSGSEYCDSGGISTGPVPQARLCVER